MALTSCTCRREFEHDVFNVIVNTAPHHILDRCSAGSRPYSFRIYWLTIHCQLSRFPTIKMTVLRSKGWQGVLYPSGSNNAEVSKQFIKSDICDQVGGYEPDIPKSMQRVIWSIEMEQQMERPPDLISQNLIPQLYLLVITIPYNGTVSLTGMQW